MRNPEIENLKFIVSNPKFTEDNFQLQSSAFITISGNPVTGASALTFITFDAITNRWFTTNGNDSSIPMLRLLRYDQLYRE